MVNAPAVDQTAHLTQTYFSFPSCRQAEALFLCPYIAYKTVCHDYFLHSLISFTICQVEMCIIAPNESDSHDTGAMKPASAKILLNDSLARTSWLRLQWVNLLSLPSSVFPYFFLPSYSRCFIEYPSGEEIVDLRHMTSHNVSLWRYHRHPSVLF